MSPRCCRTHGRRCPATSRRGCWRSTGVGAAQADPSFDFETFVAQYAIMGAQRATKILGLFMRLDRRDGKPQYLRLLPRIEQTLARNLAHPTLEPLRRWFETFLPRALGAPLEE